MTAQEMTNRVMVCKQTPHGANLDTSVCIHMLLLTEVKPENSE